MAKKKVKYGMPGSNTAVADKEERKAKPAASPVYNRTFENINFWLMIGGSVLIILGYFLMTGGRQAGEEFIYEELYSFRRITLSPIVILIGFTILIFGIMYRPIDRVSSTEAGN